MYHGLDAAFKAEATAWELLREIRRRADVAHHPLLEGRLPVRRSAILVIGGNRGLVGAFNQHIVSEALVAIRSERAPVDVITAGRVAALAHFPSGKGGRRGLVPTRYLVNNPGNRISLVCGGGCRPVVPSHSVPARAGTPEGCVSGVDSSRRGTPRVKCPWVRSEVSDACPDRGPRSNSRLSGSVLGWVPAW